MKRALVLFSGIMILLIIGWSGSKDFFSSPDAAVSPTSVPRVAGESLLEVEASSASATTMPVAIESLRLLDAASQAGEDIAIIQQLLLEYRRNLGGNPVGENDEVTAALTGTNGKKLAYLAPEVRRLIDREGRLTDRWGNPYVFHALSAQTMEVRSAGPDGIPYNADDLVSDGS